MEESPKPAKRAGIITKLGLAASLLSSSVEGVHAETPLPSNPDKNIESEYKDPVVVPEHAYILSAEDFEKKTEINLANYFETDKADISEANKNQIIQEFEQFLASITNENISQVLASRYVIYGSSDQRITNAWKGGNKELTEMRIGGIKALLAPKLQTHDFSKQHLTAEQIFEVRNLSFGEVIPEYPDAEAGVTPLTAFTNPATKKLYTKEEIQELDQATRDNLLQQARKVTLHMEVIDESKFGHQRKEGMTESNVYQEFIQTIAGYDRAIFLSDNSPSMKNSVGYLAATISEFKDILPKETAIATFSDHVSAIKWNQSPDELVASIHAVGSGDERIDKAIIAAFSELEKVTQNPLSKNAILVATDEKLKGLSESVISLIETKKQETNTEVFFVLIHDNDRNAVVVPFSVVKESFQRAQQEKINPLQKQIVDLEKHAASAHGADKRGFEERITNLNKIIDSYKKDHIITVDQFQVGTDKAITMPGS